MTYTSALLLSLSQTKGTYDVLSKKDDKDKGKHRDQARLDYTPVAVLLLKPRRHKDRENRADTRALAQARLPGGRELVADLFVDIDAKALAVGRDAVKVALYISSLSCICSMDSILEYSSSVQEEQCRNPP